MRLLVTGAAGMLGRDVVAAAESAGHDVTALARRDLDIVDPAAVRAAVDAARPDAVVNCAAWTDVDGAEEHEADATRINGDGAGNVAAAAPYVVHVSSDYVFDGTATVPYREDDPTGPGRRLRALEARRGARRRRRPGDHAVVRSAWLFGVHGKNFVATMLRLAEDRDEVNVVADQIGCPTFTGHLAPALVEIAEQRLGGVMHVAGGGSCSWHALAQATFDEAAADCRALPVTTAEFPRPAPRPAWSVLGSTRPEVPALPAWREGLSAYLRSEVLQ